MFKQSCLMCLSCPHFEQTLFLKIMTKQVTASWNLYSVMERQVVNLSILSKHVFLSRVIVPIGYNRIKEN